MPICHAACRRRDELKQQCKACGRKLVLPSPVDRPNASRVVRVPPEALKKQLRRGRGGARTTVGPRRKANTPNEAETVTLRPGERYCTNPECGAAVPVGGNVCPVCGMNLKTSLIYEGPGPDADPIGKWRAV